VGKGILMTLICSVPIHDLAVWVETEVGQRLMRVSPLTPILLPCTHTSEVSTISLLHRTCCTILMLYSNNPSLSDICGSPKRRYLQPSITDVCILTLLQRWMMWAAATHLHRVDLRSHCQCFTWRVCHHFPFRSCDSADSFCAISITCKF